MVVDLWAAIIIVLALITNSWLENVALGVCWLSLVVFTIWWEFGGRDEARRFFKKKIKVLRRK